MRVAVLHTDYAGSDLPFVELDADGDVVRHFEGHEVEEFRIAKATAVRQVNAIARRGFDVVLNLCDGSWEDDSPGVEVVQALERLNVAFTGAGSRFYDPSREAMKMACHSAGVAFPAYVVARDLADADRALAELRFPMIVKHPQGYASVGLTRDSRVADADALRRETARVVEAYGAALIEEFVEGREFTVLVAEPRDETEDAWALTPVECEMPEGETFQHFDLKWKTFEDMGQRLVTEEPLATRLREAAVRTFVALGGDGYARCDLRMSEDGEVHLLEINPNCGMFYPEGVWGGADYSIAHEPDGLRGFVEHLLRCALRRRDAAVRPWEVRHRRGEGFGLFATRALAEGEVAVRYEERPHVLVSRRHVERHWRAGGLRREWFERYAWPLTGDLHVLWSDDPEEWRPLNHSCDPNTWLDGLDLVARRPIAAGEQLTADYATFCGPAMAAFDCGCGAPGCRRVITGGDHLLPEIRERYRGHVSEFVRAAWAEEPTRR